MGRERTEKKKGGGGGGKLSNFPYSVCVGGGGGGNGRGAGDKASLQVQSNGKWRVNRMKDADALLDKG